LYRQKKNESFSILRELIRWQNKRFETQSFFTPPNTIAIDFETIYNEKMY